jgi:hypothetical protein
MLRFSKEFKVFLPKNNVGFQEKPQWSRRKLTKIADPGKTQ